MTHHPAQVAQHGTVGAKSIPYPVKHHTMQSPVPGCLFFVSETIRTSAMRVIHITVKTDETQKTAH